MFTFYTGVGHRKNNKLVKPELSNVLSSLLIDAEACEMSFEDWCCNFGYDDDSIKAMETYRSCQKETNKLNKAGIYFTKGIREFLEGG